MLLCELLLEFCGFLERYKPIFVYFLHPFVYRRECMRMAASVHALVYCRLFVMRLMWRPMQQCSPGGLQQTDYGAVQLPEASA